MLILRFILPVPTPYIMLGLQVLEQCRRLPYYQSSNGEAYDLICAGQSFGQEDELPDDLL